MVVVVIWEVLTALLLAFFFCVEGFFWIWIIKLCLLKRLLALFSKLEAGRLLWKLIYGVVGVAGQYFLVVLRIRVPENFWLHTRDAFLIFERAKSLLPALFLF